MKFKVTLVVAAIAVAAALTGCSTLLGGGASQTVRVSADRPDATFLIRDSTGNVVYEGKDPGNLTLARKYTYYVQVTAPGYATQSATISQGINGWFWGNICFGGIPGMAIDFVTGAMWDLQPTNLSVKLKVAMAPSGNGFVVSFYTKDDNGDLRSFDLNLDKI